MCNVYDDPVDCHVVEAEEDCFMGFADDEQPTIEEWFWMNYETHHNTNMPVAKIVPKFYRDRVPSTLMYARSIQGRESNQLLHVLFDSGGSHTLINSRCLPPGAVPTVNAKAKLKTIAGDFMTNRNVTLRDLKLTEFDKSKVIDEQSAYVFDEPSQCDMILGRDFLNGIGLEMSFKTNSMKWMDIVVDMKSPGHWSNESNVLNALLEEIDEELEEELEQSESFAAMLDARYEKVNTMDVADEQHHLTAEQRRQLGEMLKPFEVLFDGEMGCYPHEELHLDVKEDAVPVHSRPYSVPKANEAAFRKELDHLCSKGILKKVHHPTEWASPTFTMLKKDGRVRWISGLRNLNKVLKRKVHNLPVIQDILRKRSGYAFCTKLDLSMFYYNLKLDKESQELCTIVTPYGTYQCTRLAMGLSVAPDMAQAVIEKILDGLDVDAYIDDIGVFTKTWDEHLKVLSAVLHRLQD